MARKLWAETHPVRTSSGAIDADAATPGAAVTARTTSKRGRQPPAPTTDDETKPIQILGPHP
jgi:hypothetical protein